MAYADLQRATYETAIGAQRDAPPVDATGADFFGADLSAASLRRAILRRAKFRNAVLRDTVLEDADCTEADFRGADLCDHLSVALSFWMPSSKILDMFRQSLKQA